jgi:cytidylate kinase
MMMNIAIDGPSGAGKSTLARAVAEKLGIHYLDTGSMYRAVAFAALREGVDIGDPQQVVALIRRIDLRTEYRSAEQVNLLGGEDVMPYIRTPEISKGASDISAYPCVREKLVAMQRDVARRYDVVLDGRDIGTYVLPDAKYKFFITADAGERARRRHAEMCAQGIEKDYVQVLSDMMQRDKNDSTRALAPLKKAADAVEIDTTHMDIDAVLTAVLAAIGQEKV